MTVTGTDPGFLADPGEEIPGDQDCSNISVLKSCWYYLLCFVLYKLELFCFTYMYTMGK
jgi:hypothetical protein